MIKIDGKKIGIVRGNYFPLTVTTKNKDGSDYIFQLGDVLRFKNIKKNEVFPRFYTILLS